MSNTIEMVLVGNLTEGIEARVNELGLLFSLYPNDKHHGGDQLILTTEIRATSVNVDGNADSVKKLIGLVQSLGEDDLNGSVLSLTIEDDGDTLTGVYTSACSED